jgi:hypothetical protein
MLRGELLGLIVLWMAFLLISFALVNEATGAAKLFFFLFFTRYRLRFWVLQRQISPEAAKELLDSFTRVVVTWQGFDERLFPGLEMLLKTQGPSTKENISAGR